MKNLLKLQPIVQVFFKLKNVFNVIGVAFLANDNETQYKKKYIILRNKTTRY